jgi:hypothetical protein
MSFLDILPREIRNEIFEYVFTANHGVRFEPINSSPPILYLVHAHTWIFGIRDPMLVIVRSARISFAVLHTCKQILHECKDLFWKCNAVLIDDTYPAFDLPDCIKSKIQAVQLLVDALVTDKRKGCFPLNEDFIHLGPGMV